MPIAVVCSHCGHRAGAKDEWAGKRLKCPACGSPVTVPGSAQTATSSGTPASQGAPHIAAPSPVQPRQPPAPDLFGADLGAAADPFAGAAATPLAPALGPATARPRKASNSTKTVLIVLGVVGGVMFLGCLGLVALLVPAIQQARERARANIAAGGLRQMPPPLPANLPVWSADPALVAQLGEEVTFDKYAMRIPKTFALTEVPETGAVAPGRMQKWAWAGPPSPRGDRKVVLAILLDTTGPSQGESFDQMTSGFIQGVQQTAPAQFGAQSRGILLGKQFARFQYTITPPNSVELHAIAYLGLDGGRLITVQSLCADAEGSESHRLLDTSLLTLREK